MNIPQDTLQQVADAAFLSSNGGMMGLLTCNKEKNHVFWHEERYERRDVIQHALDNPAIAPFLAALPRRESPALAEALEEAGNRQAALLAACTMIDELKSQKDRWYEKAKRENELYLKEVEKYAEAIARAEKAEKELADIKSSMPTAEVTQPVEVAIIEEQVWVDPVCGCIRSPDAPKDSPCPICKPDALVPLGPEDVPPGSALRSAEGHWFNPTYATTEGVATTTQLETRFIAWAILMNEGWQINTSIPDTGRWDANAWRPCSKPGKEVEK